MTVFDRMNWLHKIVFLVGAMTAFLGKDAHGGALGIAVMFFCVVVGAKLFPLPVSDQS